MADLTKLSDKDLEALSRNDLSSVSDEGLSILEGTASQRRVAPAPVAEFKPYKTEEGSITKKLRQSKIVTEILGPDPEQLLRLEQQRAAAGATGPLTPQQQFGTVGAIGRSMAQALGGPDIAAYMERTGAGPTAQAIGEFARPGESVATLAGIAGAQKGMQMGRPAGPYGQIAGAAMGGALGYGAERARQAFAQGEKPATAGEILQFGMNSPMIAASPLASRAVNAATNAVVSGTQSMTADQAKKLVDEGQAMGLVEAASRNAPVFAMGALAGAATKGVSIRPIDVTASKLRDAGFVIPRGVTKEGENLASVRNAKVMEYKLVQANGLRDVSELNEVNLRNKEQEAIRSGYDPIKRISMLTSDKAFRGSIDEIEKEFTAAERAAPGVLKDEIKDTLSNLKKMSVFDGDGALALISGLREQATGLFKEGKGRAGAGILKAANSLEDLLDRNLEKISSVAPGGKSLIDKYRQARQQYAVAYATREGLRRGGGVVPREFAKMLEDGVPVTGSLLEIGLLANNFPRFAKDPSKISSGVSAIKQFLAAPGAIAGATYAAGQPASVQMAAGLAGAASPYITNIYDYASMSRPFQAGIGGVMSPETAQYLNLLARQREAQNP